MRIQIALIVDIRCPALAEICAKLLAPALEERPDDDAASGRHPGETAWTGAPNEAQQEGFGLVIARVPERDDIGGKQAPRPLEEFVSACTGSRFNGQVPEARAGAHVAAIGSERDVKAARRRRRTRFVAVRQVAKLMVEVGCAGKVYLARHVKVVHEVQQRDRIGAARQRHHQARVRAEQPVLPNESPDAVE
jgi:hypothetical protein